MRNFNHLYYFYIVAKLGGLTAAALQLHTSQSSLSTQMKTLEAQLGHTLFKREGRKIVLTKTGQSVFSYCRRMFDIANEFENYLAQSDHRGRPSFSIGVSQDIDRPYVTDAISRTIQTVSATQKPLVTQVSHAHEKLIAKLELGELDVIISSQPVHSQSVKTIAELKLPVKAIARTSLGRSIPAMFDDVGVGIVLASQDMRLRWETDDYLTKKKLRKAIAFESNVVGALLRAVIDGLGIGFLPEAYLTHELELRAKSRDDLIVSREPLWTHRIYVNARNKSTSEEHRLMLATLAAQLDPLTMKPPAR